jgi:Rps23 Pro-64 3,4-dihydroxylase Tpa1-like proline 4-hydroxylase
MVIWKKNSHRRIDSILDNNIFSIDISSRDVATALAASYKRERPFPHAVIKNLFEQDFLAKLASDVNKFNDFDGEKDFFGAQKKRFCSSPQRLPPTVLELISACHSKVFIAFLEVLTGEQQLHCDQNLMGGGIHSILPGGFLKVHADFNWHEELGMYRRLNLLIFLNAKWPADWGGDLELWASDMSDVECKVAPELNTSVVFTTDEDSYHGHPSPLTSPVGVSRNSIALYYYSPVKPSTGFSESRSTAYKERYTGELGSGSLGQRISAKLKTIFSKQA